MINHAEWLDSYYSKEVGDECRKDAKKYLKEENDRPNEMGNPGSTTKK
jgi:hypothetical protein